MTRQQAVQFHEENRWHFGRQLEATAQVGSVVQNVAEISDCGFANLQQNQERLQQQAQDKSGSWNKPRKDKSITEHKNAICECVFWNGRFPWPAPSVGPAAATATSACSASATPSWPIKVVLCCSQARTNSILLLFIYAFGIGIFLSSRTYH